MKPFDDIIEKLSSDDAWLDPELSFEIECRIVWFLKNDRHWATAFPHNETGTWREQADELDAPRYTQSIDIALSFAYKALTVNSITLTLDPSGEGASIIWWPEGLSGEVELKEESVGREASVAILLSVFKLQRKRAKQLDPLREPEVPQFVLDAFEKRYKGQYDLKRFDYSVNWGNTHRYANDFIQAKWEGWRDGYLALKDISK